MSDWLEFGDGDQISDQLSGILAEESTGLMAGVAAAATGRELALVIDNIDDYPDAEVEENGEHNFDPIPADIEATAFIDSEAVPLPSDDPLLLDPPQGKKYRFIFGASASGLVPGSPDATLIRIDTRTAVQGRDITLQENGTVTLA